MARLITIIEKARKSMANFIKIGDRVINFDNVAAIHLDANITTDYFNHKAEKGIRVYLTAPEVQDRGSSWQTGNRTEEFLGEEAAALSWYLTERSYTQDVIQQFADSKICERDECSEPRAEGSTWCTTHQHEWQLRSSKNPFEDENSIPF
jgi:hypothetical protein